jgi:hypothetical protein
MGVKGSGSSGLARLPGRKKKGAKRACQAGLYNKLAGIRKHRSVGPLDNRPDPFQRVAVFLPAERTGGFSLMGHECYRRKANVD